MSSDTMLKIELRLNSTLKTSSKGKDCPKPYIYNMGPLTVLSYWILVWHKAYASGINFLQYKDGYIGKLFRKKISRSSQAATAVPRLFKHAYYLIKVCSNCYSLCIYYIDFQ